MSDFPRALLAIGAAWRTLAEAERGGPATRARIAEAIRDAHGNPHLLVRAGELLASWGMEAEARDLLAGGLAPDAPIAPLQFAYARRLRALGDRDGARRWYRGGLLRVMPDGAQAMLLELAEMEADAGDQPAAMALLRAAIALPCRDAGAMIAAGRRLSAAGRPDFAYAAFAAAYERGARDTLFLGEFAALAAGGGIALADAERDAAVASLAAHARLAAAFDPETLLAVPRAREASGRWVPLADLSDLLAERIAARRPFSWIRLGDGEARFLLYVHGHLRAGLGEDEARTLVRRIWSMWFGQDIAAVDADRLAGLARQLDTAIGHADLLGLASVARFLNDPNHFGYCAVLETHVANLLGKNGATHFTEALFTYPLNEADPFLRRLLGGLDFLGVISPHPELAARLAKELGIAVTASYDIPGESRLGRAREAADRGRHFPEVYDRILATLHVPFPGAVFIVAGGLLGKIYCDRIRTLSGVALDIGAVVDAWMGINTRGSSLDKAMGAVLPD
ncbi:hypothetical protein [Sphingomonas quercus]|uniref:Tetratricopeptide repeat protein n=1 Tax=Sphingomonas quercus TaxID=2842451 RepID=A0ABS6BEF2_9SPHN|nr:hypothetical protein [Sphingomonas quercus]MBU3076696.1 hypothetical protein [Sphingomonas quercus]